MIQREGYDTAVLYEPAGYERACFTGRFQHYETWLILQVCLLDTVHMYERHSTSLAEVASLRLYISTWVSKAV